MNSSRQCGPECIEEFHLHLQRGLQWAVGEDGREQPPADAAVRPPQRVGAKAALSLYNGPFGTVGRDQDIVGLLNARHGCLWKLPLLQPMATAASIARGVIASCPTAHRRAAQDWTTSEIVTAVDRSVGSRTLNAAFNEAMSPDAKAAPR